MLHFWVLLAMFCDFVYLKSNKIILLALPLRLTRICYSVERLNVPQGKSILEDRPFILL